MNREQRISRKHEVQRQIAQTRQRLASIETCSEKFRTTSPKAEVGQNFSRELSHEPEAVTFLGRYFEKRRIKRQIAKLQSNLDSLMAQEYRLRIEIDQSR